MVRFKGGELLQHGRGIGGLLRLVKSVFKPLVRTAGKTIVKAAKSDVGKQVLKNLKDQAIESGVHLTSAAMRGDDIFCHLYFLIFIRPPPTRVMAGYQLPWKLYYYHIYSYRIWQDSSHLTYRTLLHLSLISTSVWWCTRWCC